jgi:protein O-GlcNAc transferase
MLNVSNSPLQQLFATGLQHHHAGRLAEAQQAYRQLLAQAPHHADAWHMLGALTCQLGQPQAARDLIARAVALEPRRADFHCNLGEVCRQAGGAENLRRAEAELLQAIALDPRLADAHTNLATLYADQQRHPEALHAAQAAAAIAPHNAGAHRLMADSLLQLRRHDEALAAYQQTLALQPNFTAARFNLAVLLVQMDRLEEALAAFRAVLAATPDDCDAWLQIAETLFRLRRDEQATQELTALTQRFPNYAPAHRRLAELLRDNDCADEALVEYRRAIQTDPNYWFAQANLTFVLRDQARVDEALALQRQLLERHPDEAALRSGLIFTMQLSPGVSRAQVRQEQALWNRRHGDPLAAHRGNYPQSRDPQRRIRIAYLSADLRSHPVGWFMLPLIRNHDRTQVEIFCLHTTHAADAVTAQIRQSADHTLILADMNDDQAAAAIRAAGIDILIDLNNHTIGNRMPLLARKPAPVQISYLAFSAGTGLETIDWRLTDPHIDPTPAPDDDQPFEKPLRLPETYWCYAPHPAAGDVSQLPARAAGHLTFGSLNHFSKCNDQLLALWARLLTQIPTARLLLCVPTGSRQQYVRAFFQARGIDPGRLTLVGRVNETAYFQHYQRIDIALDTFPWAGGTTTCDALYKGVPVITQAGPPGETLQRCGISILTNLGHPEWVASSPDEYVAKAQTLAADLSHLAQIRATLRNQMRRSALMDAPRFARHVETAYRHAWTQWCASTER